MNGAGRKPQTAHKGGPPEIPCTCAMRHIYRFVEPVILYLLKNKGHSYGYDLASDLKRHALTDAAIEKAALYRTLRHLEVNGFVASDWELQEHGPARRVYALTFAGERHLEHWAGVLDGLSDSMSRFVGKVHSAIRKGTEAKAAPPPRLQRNEYRHETVTR